MLTDLEKVKKELEGKLQEVVRNANLPEEVKENLLNFRYGSVNYQLLPKKIKGKTYLYHHLSANVKGEDGKWKTKLIKSVRNDDGTLKRISVLYNSIKRISEIIEELKEVGLT